MKNGLVLAQALFLTALLIFATVLALKIRRQKKQQDALVAQLKGQRFWRVNLATEGFLDRLIRLAPFEAKGVLIDEGDTLRIKGFWQKSGKPVESAWTRSSIKVEWLGNATMRSGNLYWARLATPKGHLYFSADTGINAMNSREALSDIFRSAFPELELTEQHTKDFALEKNPRSLAVVGAFFALLLFALLDTFIWNSFELADAQLGALFSKPIVVAALLLGMPLLCFATYRSLLGGGVPSRESFSLAGMLTMTILIAIVPALKRVDQYLSAEGTQDQVYRITGLGALEPIDESKGLPPLLFRKANEYWSQFKTGEKYPIPMLRGPIGLWQIDHKLLDKPLLAFYDKQDH